MAWGILGMLLALNDKILNKAHCIIHFLYIFLLIDLSEREEGRERKRHIDFVVPLIYVFIG